MIYEFVKFLVVVGGFGYKLLLQYVSQSQGLVVLRFFVVIMNLQGFFVELNRINDFKFLFFFAFILNKVNYMF